VCLYIIFTLTYLNLQSKLRKEVEKLELNGKENQAQIKELKQSLADSNAVHESAKGKMQLLQIQSDKMVTQTVGTYSS